MKTGRRNKMDTVKILENLSDMGCDDKQIGCESFVNQPILKYSNEIRSAVLLVHGEKAHSCYFSKDAYADMIKDSKYADNKELMIIPDAVHTDLYDGGDKDYIPFDKLENFFKENLKQ